MKVKEDIRPISYLKSQAAMVLEHINDTRRPMIITQNGEARAVLLDPESYESMQNAIGIMKLVSLGEKEIREQDFIDQSSLFSALDKRFESR